MGSRSRGPGKMTNAPKNIMKLKAHANSVRKTVSERKARSRAALAGSLRMARKSIGSGSTMNRSLRISIKHNLGATQSMSKSKSSRSLRRVAAVTRGLKGTGSGRRYRRDRRGRFA